MEDIMVLHRVIRQLAKWGAWSFFTNVHVTGTENVPKDGPLIVTPTHHNMMIDPVVLSSAFPYSRILHYWSKASLFKNPVLKWVLESTGNIPVDRGSKDRQLLFKGTIQALSKGQAVALFPEGTSYTSPRILQVKDGASYAALEYTKWAREHPEVLTKGVVVVPAAIVYTEKSKYRSNVIIQFAPPISMDDYRDEFLAEGEGASRNAAKRLTRAIENSLIQRTINAPDWDTLFSAKMTRDFLWPDDKGLSLDDFVPASQTLVDLFSTPNLTPNIATCKRHLLEYYSLLQTTKLSNSVLTSLPLPKDLDPSHPTPLPGRLRTLFLLIRDSLASIARLPFFLFPLLIHSPVYAIGWLSSKLSDDEESVAQSKIVLGMLCLFLVYPTTFFFLWALFWYTKRGAMLSAATVWLFAVYHNKLINDNYLHAKRLVAAWRLLIGVWMPRRWDLSTSALSKYTTPLIPKENPWIVAQVAKSQGKTESEVISQYNSGHGSVTQHARSYVPSRRVIRHVLRARANAVKSLAILFDHLAKNGDKRVNASYHLARLYGIVDEPHAGVKDTAEGVAVTSETTESGTRTVKEVLGYLRQRGGKIEALNVKIESQWAAHISDTDTPLSPIGDEEEEHGL